VDIRAWPVKNKAQDGEASIWIADCGLQIADLSQLKLSLTQFGSRYQLSVISYHLHDATLFLSPYN
jgi:hypothetical protein